MIFVLTVVLSFCSFMILVLAAKKLSANIWCSPLIFISVQIFLGVFAKSLFLAADSGAATKLKWGYELGYLLDASVYMLFFTILLVVGYAFAIKPIRLSTAHRAANDIRLSHRDLLKLVVLCGGVTVCVLLLLMTQRDSFSSITNLVNQEQLQSIQRGRIERIEGVEEFGNSRFSTTVFFAFNSFAFVILTSLVYWRPVRNSKGERLIKLSLVACCFVILLEVLITGRRSILVGYFLLYGSIALSGVRSFRTKDILVYSLGFCGVLFVISLITVFRSATDSTSTIDVATLLDSFLEPLFHAEYFASITKLTVIMSQVRVDTMLWGASLIDWVLGLVPRPIWPEKPAVSLGPYVKAEIYGVKGTIGGIPPTFPGELYMNFMWAGLLFAPLYGYLLRIFENTCFKGGNIARYGSHWIYFFLIIPLTYGLMQNALSGAVINSIVRFVIAFFVIYAVLRLPAAYEDVRNRYERHNRHQLRQG